MSYPAYTCQGCGAATSSGCTCSVEQASIPYTRAERDAVDEEYDAVMRALNPSLYELAAENSGRLQRLRDIADAAEEFLGWLDGAIHACDENGFHTSIRIYGSPQAALVEVSQIASSLRYAVGQQ